MLDEVCHGHDVYSITILLYVSEKRKINMRGTERHENRGGGGGKRIHLHERTQTQTQTNTQTQTQTHASHT